MWEGHHSQTELQLKLHGYSLWQVHQIKTKTATNGGSQNRPCQEFPKGLQPRWKSLQVNAARTKVSMEWCRTWEDHGENRSAALVGACFGIFVAEKVCFKYTIFQHILIHIVPTVKCICLFLAPNLSLNIHVPLSQGRSPVAYLPGSQLWFPEPGIHIMRWV